MGFIDTVVSIFSSGKSRQKSKVIREAAEILEPHGLTPTALVGSGAFSEVFRVTGEDGKEFAAKLYTTKFTDLTSKQIAAVAVREISMATLLCNDNVVRAISHFRLPNDVTVLVQEYATLGDLHGVVQPGIGLPASHGIRVLTGVCAGLEYLHTGHRLVHLDLKAENILLTDDFKPKIADFDAGLKAGREHPAPLRGTPDIHPPEVVLAKKRDPILVTTSIDIWAVGMLAHLCLTGLHAWDLADPLSDKRYSSFRTDGTDAWLAATAAESARRGFTPELVALFEAVFEQNPDARPSAAELETKFAECWLDSIPETDVHADHVDSSLPEMTPVEKRNVRLMGNWLAGKPYGDGPTATPPRPKRPPTRSPRIRQLDPQSTRLTANWLAGKPFGDK